MGWSRRIRRFCVLDGESGTWFVSEKNCSIEDGTTMHVNLKQMTFRDHQKRRSLKTISSLLAVDNAMPQSSGS